MSGLKIEMAAPAQSEARITAAVTYTQRLLDAALAVVDGLDGIAGKSPRNPEIVALTILCRCVSNFHAVMILVQNQGVVEARAIVRLMYENVLWIGALQARGSGFVSDMLNDEAHNRKSLAQMSFRVAAKGGSDNRDKDSLQLRTLASEMDKQFPGGRKLSAADVAACGQVELAYLEYGRFSLDSVHCSVTALGRHITKTTGGELMVTVVPNTPTREILGTIASACKALIFAIIGVNGLVSVGKDGDGVPALIEELEEADWNVERG